MKWRDSIKDSAVCFTFVVLFPLLPLVAWAGEDEE